MNIGIFALAMMVLSTVSYAKYEPYVFQCTYNATNDGDILVKSKVNPDQDDRTVVIKSLKNGEESSLEFSDVFVIGQDDWENLSDKEREVISKLEKKLKIQRKAWFSVTQLILPMGPGVMTFYKFNSKESTLGIGIQSVYDIYETFVECR